MSRDEISSLRLIGDVEAALDSLYDRWAPDVRRREFNDAAPSYIRQLLALVSDQQDEIAQLRGSVEHRPLGDGELPGSCRCHATPAPPCGWCCP